VPIAPVAPATNTFMGASFDPPSGGHPGGHLWRRDTPAACDTWAFALSNWALLGTTPL
jgi:hypothetical protein